MSIVYITSNMDYMEFTFLEDSIEINQDPCPVLVLDWKVMCFQLLDYYKVFDQIMNSDSLAIATCFKALWGYKLNRGLDMLNDKSFKNYTILVVDDYKGPFLNEAGYWRHFVAQELGYSRYKGGRNEKPPEFYFLEAVGLEYLQSEGSTFHYVKQEYMEADDLAAETARLKRNGVGNSRQLFLGTIDSDWQGLISSKDEIYWANLARYLPRLRAEPQLYGWTAVRYKYPISDPYEIYPYKSEFGDQSDGLSPGSDLRLFDLYNEDSEWRIEDSVREQITAALEDKVPSNNIDHLCKSKEYLEDRGIKLPEVRPTSESDKSDYAERVYKNVVRIPHLQKGGDE